MFLVLTIILTPYMKLGRKLSLGGRENEDLCGYKNTFELFVDNDKQLNSLEFLSCGFNSLCHLHSTLFGLISLHRKRRLMKIDRISAENYNLELYTQMFSKTFKIATI